MKVMSIFGTRPEIIRLSRIFALLDKNFEHVMVNTSQNYTRELNSVFFDDLNIKRIDLLKMDIEGAEKEVLNDASEWMSKVDMMVIELHGDYTETDLRKDI